MLLIFLVSVILVPGVIASDSWISAGISTDPPVVNLDATGYEREALAFQEAQDWDSVVATTREGLAQFPDDIELMCLQGYALRKTGHYQESVDIISRAIPLDPEPVRYTNRAYGLLALGRYQEALNDTGSAIALDSSYASAWNARARAFLGLGNLSGAGQAIDTAISLDPASAHSWQVKGDILSQAGDCEGAIRAYQRSIAIDPDCTLPWPGLPNATVELKKTENRCAVIATNTVPATTKAGIPMGLGWFAVGIFTILLAKKK